MKSIIKHVHLFKSDNNKVKLNGSYMRLIKQNLESSAQQKFQNS